MAKGHDRRRIALRNIRLGKRNRVYYIEETKETKKIEEVIVQKDVFKENQKLMNSLIEDDDEPLTKKKKKPGRPFLKKVINP